MAANKPNIDFLSKQLQNLWGMEDAIIKSLPEMIERASDPGLKNILRLHFAETLNQTSALRGIFKQLELTPKGQAQQELREILNNGSASVTSGSIGHELDLKIIDAAKQVEQYETRQYLGAIAEAKMQKLDGVWKTLVVSLNEEKLAQVKLDFVKRNITELISHTYEEAPA